MHTSSPTHTRRRLAAAVTALGAVGLVGCAAASASDERADAEILQYEITENAARFVFDPDIVFDDGMPAYGSAFVTEGYIYPVGTLSADEDGIDADGNPEFPDEVVGTWRCYGHMIGEGARTDTGAWVISTQLYEIDGFGTIVTNGTELSDFDTPAGRAITGGTGDFRSTMGVQSQTLTGFNELMGVMLDVEFDLDEIEVS